MNTILLVVEDQPEIRKLICMTMDYDGFEVHEADNGDTGLRMVKALLSGERAPYGMAELATLAEHCTHQEDAAQKVERSVRKSEAALFMQGLIGKQFDAIVTGRTESATWVRIFTPPAEGLLVSGDFNLDVGAKIRVKLVSTNVERGFIDFEQSH